MNLFSLEDTDDPMAGHFVAWASALAPDAVEDYEPVIALAAKAVEAQPDTNQFLNTLGAILLRAGRPKESLARLEELQDRREANDEGATTPYGRTWCFLAMAHHATGNQEQAREYLEKANQRTDEALADDGSPRPGTDEPNWRFFATRPRRS